MTETTQVEHKKIIEYFSKYQTAQIDLDFIFSYFKHHYSFSKIYENRFIYGQTNKTRLRLTENLCSFIAKGSRNNLFSSASRIIIFPNHKLLLNLSKHFCDNISFLKQVFSNDWYEKPIKIKYYSDKFDKDMETCEILICYMPLESLVFENDYGCNYKNLSECF